MAFGITCARDDGDSGWEHRRSAITTLAQGQFLKGDLVALGHERTASVYTSTYSSYFGVALHDSLNSLPVGFATIAIPKPGGTAFVDLLTGEAASGLSFGQTGSIVSANGRTSTFSLLAGSVFSRIVQIVGPADSALSRIEVAFIQQGMTLYSVSSSTLNN